MRHQLPKNWRELPKPESRTCGGCNKNLPFTKDCFPVRKTSPWGLNTRCRDCYNTASRSINKTYRDRVRLTVLGHYGKDGIPMCRCCNEARIEFLSLDHIKGGGREDRERHTNSQQLQIHLIRDGFPEGYRTLCHNCNMSLGIYGYCPHERSAHVAVA
jgi:hypothetical protein